MLDIPRELEIQERDRRGEPTGPPYLPEEDYLRENRWEDSEVFNLLRVQSTSAITQGGVVASGDIAMGGAAGSS